MYFEQGALNINPLLSSRAVMTILTQKYYEAAEFICRIDGNQHPQLSADELLTLIKTPSYRMMLNNTYSKLRGKHIPQDPFFDRLYRIGIDRKSLLMKSSDPTYDLVIPAPFITSVINPELDNKSESHNITSLTCEIYNTFPIFSETASFWSLIKPTESNLSDLITALKNLGIIALEPIEDIAFNVRFIAIVEPRHQREGVSLGTSFSFRGMSGIIFLGGSVLRNPALLIESLYHESLHIKWINTYQAYDLLKFEMLQSTEKFICPWSKASENEWPFRRASAAYHVYCHLLAFHRLVVYKQGPYNEWSNERIPVIRNKIQILGVYINSVQSKVLTNLGIEFFNLLKMIGEM